MAIENISTERPKKRGGGYLDERAEALGMKQLVRPEARALARFLLATGLRVTEALVVRVEDIERGSTTLIGKGGRPRTVYYGAALRAEMQAYLLERKLRANQDPKRLFPFSRQTAWRLLEPAGWYPHLLRHTYLTRKLRETKNIRLVQEIAGHADIRTTSRYTHFQDDEIRAAMTEPRTWREKLRERTGRRRLGRRRVAAPERRLDPNPIHRRYLVYGRKGVGKTHLSLNTWPDVHRVEWTSKGRVTKALDELRMEWTSERPVLLELSTPTATKMEYAESLDVPPGASLIVEFRTRHERDEKQLHQTLFEFQPLEVDDLSLMEARQYLRHLCALGSSQYSQVRELLTVSTNPLYLRENVHRRRSEIKMSSVPITFGWLFVLLGLAVVVSKYVAIGRSAYAMLTVLYFAIRFLRRW